MDALDSTLLFAQQELTFYLNFFPQCPPAVKKGLDHFVRDREVAW